MHELLILTIGWFVLHPTLMIFSNIVFPHLGTMAGTITLGMKAILAGFSTSFTSFQQDCQNLDLDRI